MTKTQRKRTKKRILWQKSSLLYDEKLLQYRLHKKSYDSESEISMGSLFLFE